MKLWRYCLLLICTVTLACSGAFGQAVTPAETYRLRVENSLFGRVEMSSDAGKSYTLVGRVIRPATSATPSKGVKEAGSVTHSNHDGLAFGVAPGLVLKLRPLWDVAPPPRSNKKGSTSLRPPAAEPSAIVTDIPKNKGVFGSVVPPPGSEVKMIATSGELHLIPTGYAPSEQDSFVFLVSLPKFSAPGVATPAELIEKLGKEYADGAATRAHVAKRKVVSGSLTLQAKLPPGEPDPIDAVTYMVDGELQSAQNTAPFSYLWDTKNVTDGEHIVEIRAFNKAGRLLTSARALVVVQNKTGSP